MIFTKEAPLMQSGFQGGPWNLEMLIFEERRKLTGEPEENPLGAEKEPTTNNHSVLKSLSVNCSLASHSV